MALPGFRLAPMSHKDDKQYNIDNGENYFPINNEDDVNCDIAGGLHEQI